MKETVITTGMKRRELWIMLTCFLAAYLMNIIGIIKFHTPAIELLTKIPLVLLIAALFYAVVVLLRILYFLVSRLWIRNK